MVEKTRAPQGRAEYGSDIIVDLLRAYDIPYVAFNPGSSFRGIHDSLVNYGGNTKPEIIECCHEEIAVSIAHGYAKATGKPMVAIVHDVVGLQHATMAIYNAWCDRVPVIVLGATGPMDVLKRRPRIDWIHSALIPGNLVRDFVKWDDQPFSVAGFPESFMRAYRIAMTPPRGPVYICYDLGLQEERLTQPVALPDVKRYAPPVPVQANEAGLRQAAQWLVEAENPVIVADNVGRSQQVAGCLVQLAELLAVPVIDPSGRLRVNFLPDHPLSVTGAEREVLEQADLVVALDTVDLFSSLSVKDPTTGLSRQVISPKARVVQISLAQLVVGSWACSFGGLQAVDLDILGDMSLALPQLLELCRGLVERGAGGPERYKQRFERVRAIHDRLRSNWSNQVARQRDESPISVSRLCDELSEVVANRDWVLVNDKMRGWNHRLWQWTRPDQWLGSSGGGGLGYGIGASLGGALAYKGSNKLCIDIEADGEFLYASSALWTAAHHQIPVLIVMYNNRGYYNSELHAQEVARARGRPEQNKGIGNRLREPPVDFAKLAESFGVYGEGPLEKPEDVGPALQRAVKMVTKNGTPALVDVVTQER